MSYFAELARKHFDRLESLFITNSGATISWAFLLMGRPWDELLCQTPSRVQLSWLSRYVSLTPRSLYQQVVLSNKDSNGCWEWNHAQKSTYSIWFNRASCFPPCTVHISSRPHISNLAGRSFVHGRRWKSRRRSEGNSKQTRKLWRRSRRSRSRRTGAEVQVDQEDGVQAGGEDQEGGAGRWSGFLQLTFVCTPTTIIHHIRNK